MNVGVLAIHVELDAGHGHVEEDAVVDLAEGRAGEGMRSVSASSSLRLCSCRANSPCPALLDLCDVELEEAVEPLHEFLSAKGMRVSCLWSTASAMLEE